jgi:hypothetical protein
MSVETAIEKTGSYFVSQWKERCEQIATAHPHSLHPAISIAHQTGTGVSEIARQLAGILDNTEFKGEQPWGIFDQQLIEKALEGQRWPKELAEQIAEETRLFIDELMDDLFGLRPPSWVLVPQMVETTLRLAMAGHAILVGHGATVVTAELPNVFHIRLTGSRRRRTEHVQKSQKLTPEAAAGFVRREDRRRARYLKTHFHTRLDDELLYDLVINTDRLSEGDTAALIAGGAQRFFAGRRI